jgi:hypothetical protein
VGYDGAYYGGYDEGECWAAMMICQHILDVYVVKKEKLCMTTFEEKTTIEWLSTSHLILSTAIFELCGHEDGHLAILTKG